MIPRKSDAGTQAMLDVLATPAVYRMCYTLRISNNMFFNHSGTYKMNGSNIIQVLHILHIINNVLAHVAVNLSHINFIYYAATINILTIFLTIVIDLQIAKFCD